ncbi:glycine cleavage system H-protein subunit, partial [Linderina pennispora]
SSSDIVTPVSGEVVEANEAVTANTKLINKAAETDAWLYKIKLSNEEELGQLLDKDAYAKLTEGEH